MVGPDVVLAAGVEVGPLCMLDGKIRVGARTRLIGHVTILGITELGDDNVLHPGAVIGDEPQDLTYTGVARSVKIGSRNVFREYSTVHRGSERGDVTTMGDDNFMMQVRTSRTIVESATRRSSRAARCSPDGSSLGDRALVSGNCVVHQYARIGRLAMVRGLARTSRDVPPFCIMDGTHTLRGINVVGLKRAGVTYEIDPRAPPRVYVVVRHTAESEDGCRTSEKSRDLTSRSRRDDRFHKIRKARRRLRPPRPAAVLTIPNHKV